MRKLLLKLAVAAAGICVACGITGCADKYYYDAYYEAGADYLVEEFTVRQRDWVWNDYYRRYEYIFTYDNIDRWMFENGYINGSVYITERDGNSDVLTLKNMPFVHSYDEGAGAYTETIGFDVSLGNIAFYVQASDLSDIDDYLQTLTFKIVLFWR